MTNEPGKNESDTDQGADFIFGQYHGKTLKSPVEIPEQVINEIEFYQGYTVGIGNRVKEIQQESLVCQRRVTEFIYAMKKYDTAIFNDIMQGLGIPEENKGKEG